MTTNDTTPRMTHTVRAVLDRAANNDGGKIDMRPYQPVFLRAAEDAAQRGWMSAPKRGLVYTITDAGREALAAQPTND